MRTGEAAMNAYLTNKIAFRRTGRPFIGALLEWLERGIESIRARRAEAKRLQGLMLIDHTTAADIDFNPIADSEPFRSIVGLNPHIVGVSIITGNRFVQ
jgi:hypothetical protein